MIYTLEQNLWLKEYYPSHACAETTDAFNARFGTKLSESALKTHCSRALHLKSDKRYTSEQKEWLINYFPNHSLADTTTAFNIRFGTNCSQSALRTLCNRRLGLKNNVRLWFTKEEVEWLRENYPHDESRAETYARFVKKFGDKHSYVSVIATCKDMKLKKPEYRDRYQKGNLPWSTGLSKEEHKSHFKEETFTKMTDTSKQNFPGYRNALKYGKKNNEVISNLGDGSLIIIPYKIYKRMQWRGVIGKGELTKTQLAICLAQDKIEELEEAEGELELL